MDLLGYPNDMGYLLLDIGFN